MTSIGTNVYAGTQKGAYVSTNNGSNWISINNGINNMAVEKIGSDSINLYAGTSHGVYKSTNSGAQWYSINNGIPVTWYYDIAYDGLYLYTTTLKGMYRTSNGGLSWESCNNGLVSLAVIKYYLSGNRLFCGSFGGAGIQYTTNHGSSWEISNNGFYNFYAYSLALKNNLIYACGNGQGLAITSNDGLSWQAVSNNLIDRYVHSVATNNNCVFLSSGTNGMLKSTNNGLNWIQCNTGILDSNGKEIYAFDDVVFASSYSHSYRSINNGESWTAFFAPGQIESLARIGNTIIAGNSFMEVGGMIRSTNNGANWTLSYQFLPAGIVAKDSVFYFFQSYDSLYKSTDLGLSWISFSSNLQNVNGKMYVIDDKLVLHSNLGVFTSSNNGVNWIERSQGLPPSNQFFPLNLITKDNYVYLGVSYRGVWKREKSDLLSVKTISSEVPSSFLLHQNYPNPFNPKTNIRFDIPRSSHVKLIIYDALGREVATLVNEKLSAGSYETEWGASSHPSGVYFYSLQAGKFASVKKMILIK